MKRLVYGSKMKKVDRYTIDKVGIPSMVLMERAAFSVCQYIISHMNRDKKIVCVCGTGNNGADGIALARMLVIEGYKADVLVIGNEDKATDEWHQQESIAVQCGVVVDNLTVCGKATENVVTMDSDGSYSIDKSALTDKLSCYDIVVDAIFGIGLSRNIDGIYADVVEAINESKALVYAIDVPSGLCADTGKVLGTAVVAHKTFTFGAPKVGLWLYKGRDFTGELIENNIGFTENAYCNGLEKSDMCYAIENKELQSIYDRKQHSNKGKYGKILIIGGSKNVYGAAYLAAMASYRMGNGLVRMITHVNNRNLIYEKLPEVMISTYRSEEDEKILESMVDEGVLWADAVVIGPGLSKNDEAHILVKCAMRATKNLDKPIVIDADGLNLIADNRELEALYHKKTILTPHIGEAARLVDKSPVEVAESIVATVGGYAKTHNITIVAKDATTVTFGIESLDDKCHNRVCVNTTGNAGMATGGSGDILAGMIGAAVSGGIDIESMSEYIGSEDKVAEKMYLAAAVSVYVHGIAGDMAADEKGQTSMTATDILDKIGKKIF